MPEKESSPWKLPYPTSAGEVKNGATDIEELALKLNTLFNEKFLVTKKYAAGATLKSGELAVQEKSGETFTLPSAATADQVIAVFSKVAECKITSASETIGQALKAAAYKLSTGQGIILQSDGVNWLLLAGEYKHEQVWQPEKAFTKAEMEAGVEISATRPSFVNTGAGGVTVGGVQIINTALPVWVPAGQKVKATNGMGLQWIVL